MLQTVWQSVQNVVSRMPMPLEAIQNCVIAAEIAAALLGMHYDSHGGIRSKTPKRDPQYSGVGRVYNVCSVRTRVNFEVADGHSSLSIQK